MPTLSNVGDVPPGFIAACVPVQLGGRTLHFSGDVFPKFFYFQGYIDGLADGSPRGQTSGFQIGILYGSRDTEDDAYHDGFMAALPVGYQAGAASVHLGGGDVTAPTITIVSPPPGATIGQSTTIIFRYSDETALRRPLPMARFIQPDGQYKYELIHDGDNFTPDYQGTKTIVQVTPPIWQYAVNRRGGWGAVLSYHGGNPTLVPFGTDTAGNEPP